MNIPVTLNGEHIILEDSPDRTLLSVLRRIKLLSVKRGCEKGICGTCTILLDGKPVPSCKVPVALAKDRSIETLEHFQKTDEYSDIIKGFNKAGIKLCGFCNAGKIFAARTIILSNTKPTRSSIQEQVKHLSPCCTDEDTLINGIIYAFDFHIKRLELQEN